MRLDRTKVYLLMANEVFTQSALADKAGISRQTLSAVMNGKSCNPALLKKIAKALEVEPKEIIE